MVDPDQQKYKSQLSSRKAGFKRFSEWEHRNPPELSAAQALAGIGALYELMPAEFRERKFDPEGIAAMRKALTVLA
jgi:hypothetical protein